MDDHLTGADLTVVWGIAIVATIVIVYRGRHDPEPDTAPVFLWGLAVGVTMTEGSLWALLAGGGALLASLAVTVLIERWVVRRRKARS